MKDVKTILNTMATLYILVQVLTLNVHFAGVSGINFLNDTFLSKWNSKELETAMVMEQMRICPYIALCNSPNSSIFTSSFLSPCCQKCSCDYTCVEEGSCCPDFNERNITTYSTTNETSKQLAYLDVNETNPERQICVNTQYGSIPNRDGFKMIASCPSNFHDDDVRKKCEANFDYSRNLDIYDHIPVTDTDSGLTFKNRFCELCNKGKDVSATFWRVLIQCTSPRFDFNYYLVTDPTEFAETILLDRTERCNIVFDFENLMIGGLNSTPHYCETDDIIDSCDDKNSNTVLETLCSKLFWPIKAANDQGASIYKNYACMLCNGVKFDDWCNLFNADRNKLLISLTTSFRNTSQLPSTSSNTFPNKDLPHRGQVIGRYFPNGAGEVYCKKGFVYDSKKESCRLVLCPLYFYVKDRVCVPMFGVIKGIVYQVVLQADVPSTLQGETEVKVVNAIAASLDTFLRDRLGQDQYEFDIWKANTTLLQLRPNRQYLIILAISGDFDQGKYISMLKFINNFVLLKKELGISIRNDKYAEPSKISIRFNTSTELFHSWKPFTKYTYTDTFQVFKSYNGTRNLNIKDSWSTLYISPTVLCYRVALLEKEVKSNVLKPKYISIASMELVMPNFERINYNDRPLVTVCLDHAFINVPETVSYIFLNKNETNYKFLSKPKFNTQNNVNDNTDIKSKAEEESLSKDSIVPTLATIGLVVFVIGIRQTLKRLTTRERNTGSTEDTVINMTVVYRVSRDEELNINETGGSIFVGNEEEVVESILATGNDKESTNDSVEIRHTSRNEEVIIDKSTRIIHVAENSEIIKNESTEGLGAAWNKMEVKYE